jgi:CubicO group peptidase (beta-lactamase class C family)
MAFPSSRTLATALLLAIASDVAAQRAPSPDARSTPGRTAIIRRIDSLAQDAIEARRLASVAIAVVSATDTLALRAWGTASRTPEREADRNTVYRLGPVTQQFTAAMVLQLVGEGKLSLGDTVGRFFPAVSVTGRGITIAQPLNQTSGLPWFNSGGAPWAQRTTQDVPPDTVVGRATKAPLDFTPGSQWRESNTAYVMLGRIIELVDRRSYTNALSARITKPLALQSLRYCPTMPLPPRDADGFASARGDITPVPRQLLSLPYSSGALCATIDDLVRWNQALHGGRVVTPSLYARMTTPEGAATVPRFGYGIRRDSSGGHLHYVHSGSMNGFAASNAYWPDGAVSIIVLSNTEGGEVDALAEQIRRVLAQQPLVRRRTP